ncbi:transporter [Chitinophaga caeni]|uniref:Transporter n=1 Tax=Chitinophaga caeni TaxID=2029983 RepID=A0A291QP93_9BACT|nr:TolC family protein [Chitinophaga caeni]ATL45747.1 transporter [Chitinophaga caeni]
MKKIVAIYIVLLSWASRTMAQEVMGLDSILNRIETNNPSLKVYLAEANAMDAAVDGAYSWMAPTAGAGVFMAPYDISKWKSGGMGNNGMGAVMFSVEQMLPNTRKQKANAAFLSAQSSVQRSAAGVERNVLFAQAKMAYYNWWVDEKMLRVLDENEQLLNFMIQAAEIRYKNGLGKINAYYKAKAALAKLGNDRLNFLNEIRKQRILLNAFMYRPANTSFDIDSVLPEKNILLLKPDSNLLVANRSDIQMVDDLIHVNEVEGSKEKTELKPEFGIKYDHMVGFGNQPQQFSLMGMMKLPMLPWSSKATKAKLEKLKWQQVALEQKRSSIVNEALGRAFGLKNDLLTKREQLKLYREQIIPSLEKNYKAILLAYQQNTSELFELFDAWEALNMAQLEYWNQQKAWFSLLVEYEKILEQA